MQSRILLLCGISLAAALAELLLAGEKKDGVHRAFHILISFAVLFVLIQPFLHFLQNDTRLSLSFSSADEAQYTEVFYDTVEGAVQKDVESGIVQVLESEYGIGEKNCRVSVFYREDGYPARISVTLSGAALTKDPEKIEEELSSRVGCETEVR